MAEIRFRHRVDLTVYLDLDPDRTLTLRDGAEGAFEALEQDLKQKLNALQVEILDIEVEEIDGEG